MMHMVKKLVPAPFLRTICTKLEYGLALRSLSSAPWAPVIAMDPTEPFEKPQGDTTVDDLFQWRARHIWLGGDDTPPAPPNKPQLARSLELRLLRSLEMGLSEAHIAILLLLCPRVNTLEIVAPPLVETSLIARLLDTTLSKDCQTTTPPEHVSDLAQEESDHVISRKFDAPWPVPSLQKAAVLQDLVSCTIHGSGAPPSGLNDHTIYGIQHLGRPDRDHSRN
jgi:hypothetical protein